MIKVFIVDDHTMVRQGLRRILDDENDMDVVGEAGEGAEGVRKVAELHPDIILMDISMPGMDGLDATKQVITHDPHAKVIALTVHSNEEYAVRILRSGARGFILKEAAADELVGAIRKVHAGGRYVSPSISSLLVERHVRRQDKPAPLESISDRELQVLRLLALGRTNAEIAEQLFLSVKTIDTYRLRLLKKLELRNNSDLTRFAIRHSLLEGM